MKFGDGFQFSLRVLQRSNPLPIFSNGSTNRPENLPRRSNSDKILDEMTSAPVEGGKIRNPVKGESGKNKRGERHSHPLC